MATYQELFDLRHNQVLLDKVTVAVIVAAETVFSEPGGTTNHANRVIWAREASINPRGMAFVFMSAVLAANKSAAVENIIEAPDDAIQTNVKAVINNFADGNSVVI